MSFWRRSAMLSRYKLAAMTLCAGCSSASGMGSAISQDAGSPSYPSIPGFVQTLATTRCGLGAGVREVKQPGDTQWIGSQGVFDVDLANQSSFCETNPFRALTGPKPPIENEQVKHYFIGAGLPVSQMGAVSTSYMVDSSGEKYTSARIDRVVDGASVPESSAWAAMVGEESLGEGVFWPPLPASVSFELAELKTLVADPRKLAEFQGRLPAGLVAATIVIHHADLTWRVPGHPAQEVPLDAHACYDALFANRGGIGFVQCYLPSGSRHTFAPPE